MNAAPTEIVDNRVFLLGLDAQVRELLASRESHELLDCARKVAARLGVSPGAAFANDAVVLAALRETVVLYSGLARGISLETPRYLWHVDAELARRAQRYIDAFNGLFEEHLPAAEQQSAGFYREACLGNPIRGRCVAIGVDPSRPAGYYHWAISGHEPAVVEFWSAELWTTSRYEREGRPTTFDRT